MELPLLLKTIILSTFSKVSLDTRRYYVIMGLLTEQGILVGGD